MKKIEHMSKKMDIMMLYLRNYFLSFTGREIARKIKVSPQTGLILLNELVKETILKIVQEGRNKKYFLNLSDLRTKQLLQIAESYKAKQFLENFELKSIIGGLLPLSETVIIFGSFAKGKEKESSDLDLIIIGAKKKEEIEKVKKIFPREINFEVVAWNEFINSFHKKNALALEIKKDHLIYGNVHKIVDVYSAR